MSTTAQGGSWRETENGKQQRAASISRMLPRVLELGLIEVAYQPQLKLPAGEVVAFEALARWTDADLGSVSPTEFVSVAESSAQITALGNLILKKVLHDLEDLKANWPAARVAINVSAVELQDPKFAVHVTDALMHYEKSAAEHLEFELTETAFSEDVPVVTSNIQALRRLGINIAIDDFGTGASTLGRLCHVPFDKIKLDKAFIATIDHPTTRSVIKAMVTLTDEVGAQLVVEGVETEEQLAAVSSLGCSIVQGYLLGIPRPIQELVAKLKGSD